MLMRYATKRDINGNRYFLGFDTDKKIYALESRSWYGKADLDAEITRKERRAMVEKLEKAGYTEQDNI